MTIRFLLGRAGSGKSEQILQEIRAALHVQPDGTPLMLLVPEQATFQKEHALVSTPGLGGLLRAQVLSFRRLAWRVMQESGGTAGIPIDETGKAMLLTKLLHKHQNELRWFKGGPDKMGAVKQLATLLSEFKRYQVTPHVLGAYLQQKLSQSESSFLNSELQDKLHDLLQISQSFEEELARQYLDGEAYLTRLANHLSEVAWLQEADIWIDGFFGFTPQEMAAVVGLCQYARSVTIALTLNRPYAPGDQPHELDLFHPTARTMLALRKQLEAVGIHEVIVESMPNEQLPRFSKSPQLSHLEQQYELRLSSRKKVQPISADRSVTDIQLVSAVNRMAEVEGVAREMIRQAREHGLRWRDMAIRVRNLDAYGDLLAAVLTDNGVPFFMDQKRTILHHPLAELIRSTLEALDYNWRYEPIFRAVKTGFFQSMLEQAEQPSTIGARAFDELENYVLAHGIHGYQWKQDRSWTLWQAPSLEDDGKITAQPNEDYRLRLERSRQAVLQPLHRMEEAVNNSKTMHDMVMDLYNYLMQLQVPLQLTQWSDEAITNGQPERAKEHAQVWDRVMDLFEQLVQLMGDEPVDRTLFAKLIEAGLENVQLGLVPPALDQVLIGSIDRTRATQVKVSFVLGANDGELPARPKEEGILTESEREFLAGNGISLAEGSRRKMLDESFLIYTVICAPSEQLWISYPIADAEGKTLLPSELIHQIRGLFPGLPVHFLLSEPPIQQDSNLAMPFLTNETKAMSYLTVQLRQWMRGDDIDSVWWNVYNRFLQNQQGRDRLEQVIQSLTYRNQELPLSYETSLSLYGSHFTTSVSRMERFVRCPFSQFASHGLRLKERKLHRLESPEVGQLYHAALKIIVQQLYTDIANGSIPNEHQLAIAASAAIDSLAPRLQSEILLSSSRYQYISAKLKNVVRRVAESLLDHAKYSTFVPVGLELGFGPKEPLPALTYSLPNGRKMDIVGRIDRVDVAESDHGLLLRLIDYKSSEQRIQLSKIYHGLSLQMITYLDVLMTHAERWLGRPALAAGIFYYHVHYPLVQTKIALEPEKATKEVRKKLKLLGLVRADVQTVQLMDQRFEGELKTSDLIPITLTKEGMFKRKSFVATDAQWDSLRGYVRRVVKQIGTDLTDGNVSITPYQMNKETPCTFCSYKPVCAFDRLAPGNQFQTLAHPDREWVWQAVSEAAQGASPTGLRMKVMGDEV